MILPTRSVTAGAGRAIMPGMRKTPGTREGDSRLLRHLVPLAATVLVVLVLLAGTIPLLHWFRIESQAQALEDNLAVWDAWSPGDYAYTVTRHCDCARPGNVPVRVTVRNYATLDVRSAAGATAADVPADMLAAFDLVAAAIASRPGSLAVEWDERYGYPREIRIDPNASFEGDEYTWEISEFELITGPSPR